ncbi:N-acetylglucosamine-1-phosphodiester alpha-N-acetylglucosaminidase-like isoform X2 [Pecten maximus]|uniref:N-acetylglucosamine-1-phosphodiester alpha-N-acetylglucosaminidase-like isoform X2 n=1 Tax=Pecten maximus TaxID=6579 RepID=UPI001458DBC8|nr:N-acetylglucosamine-1-phosphodiester alpha-N-acetylglucosaminidase-like isoform X2 [Pecten maximus]
MTISISYSLLYLSTLQIVNSLHVGVNMTRCPKIKSGKVPFSVVKSNGFRSTSLQSPLVNYRYTYKKLDERHLVLRHVLVKYPYQTLSVHEPWYPGGCHANRTFVAKTTEQKSCMVAVNAGFFHEFGAGAGCYGNIVSDGRLVQDSDGIQNVYFGIKENGDIFTGYLTADDMAKEKFIQLVGGVIWLIRNGEVYINESMEYECSAPIKAPIQNFTSSLSARSAVAVHKDGRVILVQVDGNTNERGINLYEFADILLKFGVVQAVNLDGGGSSTLLINGTMINNPPDICVDDPRFRCPRTVSTVLCVHEPTCEPEDCSGHGQCVMGRCICYYPWTGQGCTKLRCYKDCSFNGRCTPRGCVCNAGFHRLDCNERCSEGRYGKGCTGVCVCLNGATCNTEDGSCDCAPGYKGLACGEVCDYGYYGEGCNRVCQCKGGCSCHHVTGSCIGTQRIKELLRVYHCVADGILEEETQLKSDQLMKYNLMTVALVVIGMEASISMILSLLLLYKVFVSNQTSIERYKQP